jgi:N-hydroxyarylamine O-acetyltransferase
MIDLDAYFHRIGYAGAREPTLEVLSALHLAHPGAIAYENLDPLMGVAPRLDPASLQAKLVEGGRGGYCYEQNSLFRLVLEALGFDITLLAARVIWNAPPDRPLRQRSHMLIRVELSEGPFLADVGFGGFLATAPLRFEPGLTQDSPTGRQRLVALDGDYAVEVETSTGWSPLYRFDLVPHLPVDYEPLNWFSATHPLVIFPHNLIAERLTPALRATVFNDRLMLRRPGQEPEVRVMADAGSFAEVMEGVLGIRLPAPAEAVFARVPQGLEDAHMPGLEEELARLASGRSA